MGGFQAATDGVVTLLGLLTSRPRDSVGLYAGFAARTLDMMADAYESPAKKRCAGMLAAFIRLYADNRPYVVNYLVATMREHPDEMAEVAGDALKELLGTDRSLTEKYWAARGLAIEKVPEPPAHPKPVRDVTWDDW